MTILIPVDSKNRDECIISSIEENKAWEFVTLDEGRVEKIEFLTGVKIFLVGLMLLLLSTNLNMFGLLWMKVLSL